MIPEGWHTTTLGRISTVTAGGTPSRKEASYWNGNIPWIRTTEVQNCKLAPACVAEYITEDGLTNSSAKLIPARSILLAMIGQGKTRGQVALLNFEATTNQNCAAIIPDSDCHAEFIYQALLSKYQQIRNFSNTAGQSNLSGALVKAIPVLLPPLKEQKAIAAILSKWDEAIEKTEALIAAKEKRKKALMQQLLTGKQASEPLVKLKDLFLPVRRKNTVNCTKVLTASGEHGLVDQTDYFNRSVSGANLENYYLLKSGDFAYNRSSMNGYPFGAIKRLEKYDEGILSTLYICFAPNSSDINPTFYKYYFESGVLNKQLRTITQVGARAHGLLNVTLSDFMNIKIPCPKLKEQNEAAKLLSLVDEELRLAKEELETVQKQKKALMQILLTGKKRTKAA